MLFLVISTPRADVPSAVTSQRQRYWDWIDPLLEGGTALSVHARVGRGGVVLFDVESNMALHRLLTEWAEIVPAQFDVYPLVDAQEARSYLQAHADGAQARRSGT